MLRTTPGTALELHDLVRAGLPFGALGTISTGMNWCTPGSRASTMSRNASHTHQ